MFCSISQVTGRPMSSASRQIQSISFFGATRSSPASPAGATSNTPWPGTGHRTADGEQFVFGGERAGHGFAVHRAVADRPAGREAHRAGFDGLVHELRHLGDVVGRRRFVVGATLAHHVGAQRAVGDHRGDVGGVLATLEFVEVLGKRLPVPRDALAQRGTGDVLDALHQLDQEVVLVGFGRREADAAVAHHDGGDAVRGRRFEVAVPRGLAVVVRVDVDEAGRHEQSGCVDLATPGSDVAPPIAVITSPSIAMLQFGRGAAPVPSTTSPLRMTRSCMLASLSRPFRSGPAERRSRTVGTWTPAKEIIDATTDDGEMAVLVTRPASDRPDGADWPTVLLFIDAPGIRSATREFAAKLAAEGYLVVTPDLHHRQGRLLNALDTAPPEGADDAGDGVGMDRCDD